MEWLNYHHLQYFWITAREGGVSRASEKLHLSQPTISVQIKQLEDVLGVRLFHRHGRSLVLTDTGRMVYQYAEEIFGVGRELLAAVKSSQPGRALPLTVGVSNAVPKLVACRLLRPLMHPTSPARLVCREENTEQLLTHLATHALDVVLADTPAPPHIRVRVFNHVLGESDTAFFAPPAVAARVKRRFPRSLHDTPMVASTTNTAVRRDLDHWFEQIGVRPAILGEFEDPALMKAFGAESGAVFSSPFAIARDVCRLYGVTLVGRTDAVKERYYAITAERRLTHPGVLAITSAAREGMFK
jgi:LysR family transcriptional regulator, transcriptional activator of nhaA